MCKPYLCACAGHPHVLFYLLLCQGWHIVIDINEIHNDRPCASQSSWGSIKIGALYGQDVGGAYLRGVKKRKIWHRLC